MRADAPQATRQTNAPAANGLAIHTEIPPMQRLLGNVRTLQFAEYTELARGATQRVLVSEPQEQEASPDALLELREAGRRGGCGGESM
jgi:hypothetical protein